MRARAILTGLALIVSACGGGTGSPAPPSSSVALPVSSTTSAPSPTGTMTPSPSQTPDPLAAVQHPMDDLRTSRLIADIHVGGSPDWQASTKGALWVGAGSNFVGRIDQATNEVVARVAVAEPCLGMAAGFGSIWSPACGASEVDRIDPASNKVVARIPVAGFPANGEGQIVAAYGAVWSFIDDLGTLVRIDPKTNRIAATFNLGVQGVSLVAAGTDLWATSPATDAVLQIDPKGSVVRSIPVERQPRFAASGEGAVWVLGQWTGNVSRIDPATGAVVATVRVNVPGDGGCVATGGGSVWITMPGTPISRIDPRTNAVTEQFVGEGGDCISFADGSVWLSNNGLGSVWRIKP